PGRRGKTGLLRSHFIGPNDYLFAVLPLNGDCLMGDLESARVDGKIAQDGLRFNIQKRFAELVGIETAGPSHGIHEEPAPGVRRGRLNGRGAAEFLLISSDELLIPRIRKSRLPE